MSDTENLSIYQFLEKFPDENSATTFFENRRWKDGLACPHCGSVSIAVIGNRKPMPFRCRDCRRHFSVRTGTVLAESKLPLHKWLMAIWMLHTARKGISSVQMARELGITQKTAWFLQHRIRKAMEDNGSLFTGTVEVDEAFIGGKEGNKHADKKLHVGRGSVGKQPVFGLRERGHGQVRAFPIERVDKHTLHSLIHGHVEHGSNVYSDSFHGYRGLTGYHHEAVTHSVGEYVRGDVHTNSIESFWGTLKRGYVGIFHYMSRKHLHRYCNEFAYRMNAGNCNGVSVLERLIDGMIGRRLTYKELVS